MTSPDKNALRADMIQKRKLATKQSPNAGTDLCHQFDGIERFKSIKSWSAYWPLPSELDIRPLMNHLVQQAKTVCLPCVKANNEPLIFRHWFPDTALIDGLHQIPCPPDSSPLIIPDAMFVPLLGFDQKGGRLGFGGGYYDRTLELFRTRLTPPPLIVGVAFDAQEINNVPMDRHDQWLDGILTPTRFLACTELAKNI